MKKTILVVSLLLGLVAIFAAGAFAVGAQVGQQKAEATASAANGFAGNMGNNGNGNMPSGNNGMAGNANNGMNGNMAGNGNAEMMGDGTPNEDMMGNSYGSGNSAMMGNGNGMNGGYGGSMNGGYGNGNMNGAYGGGMMGNSTNANVPPLTVAEAEDAVNAAIQSWGNPDLALGEVMIFDNQAYAEIVEKSTGIGALEVLVDPVTREVFPEYGPNMMWNLKYHLRGMGSGMMSNTSSGNFTLSVASNVAADMTITPEQARQKAQEYLNASGLDLQAGNEVTPFYGYYTIHTEKDGQIVGMLSVNGYTGAVFPHTWHGKFITMSEEG